MCKVHHFLKHSYLRLCKYKTQREIQNNNHKNWFVSDMRTLMSIKKRPWWSHLHSKLCRFFFFEMLGAHLHRELCGFIRGLDKNRFFFLHFVLLPWIDWLYYLEIFHCDKMSLMNWNSSFHIGITTLKSTLVVQIIHLSVQSNISDWKAPCILIAWAQGFDSECIFVTLFWQLCFNLFWGQDIGQIGQDKKRWNTWTDRHF